MDSAISSAIISAVTSALVSFIVSWLSSRSDAERDLKKELSEILKIGIKYPYFEQHSFTDKWGLALTQNDERYAAYDLYATLVFNHLEKWCKLLKFDLTKVQAELDMQSWVRLHAKYWKSPEDSLENIMGYDVKFCELVNKCLGKKEGGK